MLHTMLIICGVISVPFICIYISYTLLLVELPDYRAKVPPPLGARLKKMCTDNDFFYVFLLPCLNEEKVIGNTIKSILSLPQENIVIIIIDDASDDETARVVREINDSRVRLYSRKLPHARKGKGDALNSCYERVNRAVIKLRIPPQKVILGVLDGDGRPSENLLFDVMDAFSDPEVGAAQTRVRILNRQRLLPLMQDVEFATTVSAMQNFREYLGSVGLGGNGQFTRLSTLQSLGNHPWTKCLLEDFDLGLRILLSGWRIRFLSESFVAQQGLTSYKRFIRQRTRWAQGNMQCLHYLASILHAPMLFTSKIDLVYFLLQPWMNLLGTVLQITSCIAFYEWGYSKIHFSQINMLLFLQLSILLCLTLAPGCAFAFQYYRAFTHRKLKSWIIITLLFPLYNLLMIPSVWLALWRQITGKIGWAKTERLIEQKAATTLLNPADLSNV